MNDHVVRKLTFMPDFSADPLWEDGCMVSLDSLPASEATRASVRDWASSWEDLSWREIDAESAEQKAPDLPTDLDPQTRTQLEHEGRRVCKQLCEELGPEFEVTWRSWCPEA